MKRLLLFLILTISISSIYSQDWQWVKQFGAIYDDPQNTGSYDKITDMKVGSDGSVYFIMVVYGDLYIHDTTIYFSENSIPKSVIGKLNCEGDLQWINGFDNHYLKDIIDFNDSTFLVRSRNSLIQCNKLNGSTSIYNSVNEPIFWSKYTAHDGKVYGIVAGPQGVEYRDGNYFSGYDTTYLVRHDLNGNVEMFNPFAVAVTSGNVAYENQLGFAKSNNGSFYITGQTQINSIFKIIGGDTVDGTTGFAGIEAFMIKIDSTGNHIWTKQTTGGGYMIGYDYDRLNDHHIMNISFDDFFDGQPYIKRPALRQNHIMVLEGNTNVIFNDQYGESSLSNSTREVAYHDSKVSFMHNVVYGDTNREMPIGTQIAHVDSPAVLAPAFSTFDTLLDDGVPGDYISMVVPQGSRPPEGSCLEYDNNGNLYYAGTTPLSITFNDSTYPYRGGDYDVFIAKWGTDTCPGAVCPEPTQLAATSITDTSAQLNWTSNESSWNIEYGQQGFTQGTGTVVSNLTQTNHTITSLQSSTNYEFYVQTNCSANDQSQWSGPVAFTTGSSPCTSPSSLAANNVTENGATLSWQSSVPTQDLDHFIVEWGTQGFNQGNGDTAHVTSSSYDVTNLNPNEDYDFYVSAVCNNGSSTFAGPETFTTLTTGLAEQLRDKLKVYPNPAENGFYVMSKQTTNSTISVYNVTGSVVYEKDLSNTLGPVHIPTKEWPGGMYVVQLKKAEKIIESERVVVK